MSSRTPSRTSPRPLSRASREVLQNASAFTALTGHLRAMQERAAAERAGRPTEEIVRLRQREEDAAERAAATPTVSASTAAAAAEAAATAAAAAAEAAAAAATAAAELSTMGVRTMSLSNFTRPLPRYLKQNARGVFHNETGQAVSRARVQTAWAHGVPTQQHFLGRHIGNRVPESVRTRNARAAAASAAAAAPSGPGGGRRTNKNRRMRKATRKYRK